MAISGVNTYNNAYENVYATKQKEEIKETSAAQKKGDTENKGGLLNQLQDKYSNFDITAGTFSKGQVSSSSKGFQGVMVSSAYLSKAENDENTAQDLDEMLNGVESAYNWLKNAYARDGLELVSCGCYIDENGKMGSYSVVEKKHSMFDGLAEQSEKSADRIKEKQEKAREEKRAARKEQEKKAEKERLENRHLREDAGMKVIYNVQEGQVRMSGAPGSYVDMEGWLKANDTELYNQITELNQSIINHKDGEKHSAKFIELYTKAAKKMLDAPSDTKKDGGYADWKEKVEKTKLPATFQNIKYNGFQSFLESLQNQSSLSNSWVSGNINRFMKWLTV
ncbi:hypothetical protein IMSAGC009_01241 [Lachnospiraceae bacterium]|nr:hypothetical protein IMSAGC009_01241 [Lachnospiraceae bacterium]